MLKGRFRLLEEGSYKLSYKATAYYKDPVRKFP